MPLLLGALTAATLATTFQTTLAPRERDWEDILSAYSDEQREAARTAEPVVVPEAYELAMVILSLSALRRDEAGRDYVAASPYQDRVEERFAPFADHPAVAMLDGLEGADWTTRYELRENAYAYCFDDEEGDPDRLYRCQPFSHVWGRQNNLFSTNLDLIEDFARVSEFRAFYAEQAGYYRELTDGLAGKVDPLDMRDWLSARFASHVDAFQVVISPLTDGWHSTQRFDDDAFLPVALFVEPGLATDRDDAMQRMVFTELDHNYVNPATEPYADALNEDVSFGAPFWTAEGPREAYSNGEAVFNEYATFAVFELWARERHGDGFSAVRERQTHYMEEYRGFVRYRAFADELTRLHDEAAASSPGEAVRIETLYPDLIAWSRAYQATDR